MLKREETKLIESLTESFFSALHDRDINKLEKLLNDGFDINTPDNMGQTALIKSVKYNYPEITNYLIQNNANPIIADDQGNTVLNYFTRANETILTPYVSSYIKKLKEDTLPNPYDSSLEIEFIEDLVATDQDQRDSSCEEKSDTDYELNPTLLLAASTPLPFDDDSLSESIFIL